MFTCGDGIGCLRNLLLFLSRHQSPSAGNCVAIGILFARNPPAAIDDLVVWEFHLSYA